MNTPTLMQSEELRAPWNEPETPMKKFEVTCSQSLSKTVLVMTDNYVSDTNWGEEYHDNDYHTPDQLISLFKQFLEEQKAKGVFFKSEMYTDWLIKDCSNWIEDETEYIEES